MHSYYLLRSGKEKLKIGNRDLSWSILDFWQFSYSSIFDDATRDKFAKFIVATVTNINMETIRNDYAAYDFCTKDGIKLGIKSAGYIQGWFQKRFLSITFSIKPIKYWDHQTNKLVIESTRQADVFIFCLLWPKDLRTVEPLNMDHWEFYVLGIKQIEAYFQKRHPITLKLLKKLTSPVPYNLLYNEIIIKNSLNK